MSMMTIDGFFKSVAHRKHVAPRAVQLTAGTSEEVLPGGDSNPSKQYQKVTATGAFVFISVERTEELQTAAWADLRDRTIQRAARELQRQSKITYEEALAQTPPPPLEDGQRDFAVQVFILHEALRAFDSDKKEAGPPLFQTTDLLRKLLVPNEVHRLFKLYKQYVAEEHPEVIGTATFPESQKAGPRVSVSSGKSG